MHVEYHKIWSTYLNQDMEFKIYGHAGKPMVVFPTSWGRFFEYEDRGMIAACQEYIDSGKIRVIAVDSVDTQSWLNRWIHPAERAIRHNQYDHYIVRELNHFVRDHCQFAGKFITTGSHLGGYHAVNFLFKHPDVFDTTIALSGIYNLYPFTGNYVDENIYYNSPLKYLPNLENPWFLNHLKSSRLILCVGQGVWEDNSYVDTIALRDVLLSKEIPVQFEAWGELVDYDWPWWHRQIRHFLGQLAL